MLRPIQIGGPCKGENGVMPESERQIGFEQLGIGSVLARHTLQVPPNQREYSWTDREIRALFFDYSRAISENASEYFLGSLVTIPRKPGVLEVVDGQQRLATTTILLAAIRDYLRSLGGPNDIVVEDIENRFLSSIDRVARERVPKIRLNVLDNAYFEKRIMDNESAVEPTAPSHHLIHNAAALAAEHVKKIVSQHDQKVHGDVLNKWIDFIEHRAIVILLKVPDDINAYRMFETLNDRGLRTSQSDLVKNFLFGESADRLPEVQHKWASMKGLLESVEEDDITINFLRQMLISLHGYLREPDVYEKVQANARGPSQALHFMTLLESGAADYVAMLNPEHETWNHYPASTRRAIQTLVMLRMRPTRPVVLSVTRKFSTDETDKALRFLVNMSVRFLIVGGGRSGSVEQALAAAAKDISEGVLATAKALSSALARSIPTDTQFEEQFKVATVSQAYLARYYLRSLELQAQGAPDPCFIPNDDQQAINLEHVLPQNPGTNWPQFTEDAANAFYRRIGNMALLQARFNSDLRSAPFPEKKAVYSDSPYDLTRKIAEETEWNVESISRRQSFLARLAVDTWSTRVS